MEFKRRLAAILAADVKGYSRLMAADGRGTVAALDAETAHRLASEAVRTRLRSMRTGLSKLRDRGSESRERSNTFVRIAAGLEDQSAADALR